jgi:hypothetical protein
MRVGQLARKLGISPTELINFLTLAGIQTSEASNTKLSAENLQVAIKHFDPTGKLQASWQDESKQEEVKEEIVAVAEPVLVAAEEITTAVETRDESIDIVDEQEVVQEEPSENKSEVIKAPKVELAGLKVLGKIELPEKKKKEPTAENTTSPESAPLIEETRPPRREPRHSNPRHQGSRNDRGARKNPIALKREQEAAEAERKRQEEAKLAKERRTQHYLSKVKSVPTKPARLIREDVVELHAEQSKKTPTTWIGKFWRWFRS